MTKSTEDLIRIAAAGGRFTIDGRNFTTENLIKIAAAASEKGSRIHIQNVDMRNTKDLIRISAAGKGFVTLDL